MARTAVARRCETIGAKREVHRVAGVRILPELKTVLPNAVPHLRDFEDPIDPPSLRFGATGPREPFRDEGPFSDRGEVHAGFQLRPLADAGRPGNRRHCRANGGLARVAAPATMAPFK